MLPASFARSSGLICAKDGIAVRTSRTCGRTAATVCDVVQGTCKGAVMALTSTPSSSRCRLLWCLCLSGLGRLLWISGRRHNIRIDGGRITLDRRDHAWRCHLFERQVVTLEIDLDVAC